MPTKFKYLTRDGHGVAASLLSAALIVVIVSSRVSPEGRAGIHAQLLDSWDRGIVLSPPHLHASAGKLNVECCQGIAEPSIRVARDDDDVRQRVHCVSRDTASQNIQHKQTANVSSTVLREEACHMSVTKTCHCVGGARNGAANTILTTQKHEAHDGGP